MYKKVYIEITNICNMNCSFCHGHSRAPRQMTMEEFALILDKIKGQTEYIYYHLMGEPLLHPELASFLSLARDRGYKSIITTNGTLVSARGEEILSSGVHKVNLSLHSFEEDDEDTLRSYIKELSKFSIKAFEKGTIVVFRLWNKGYDNGKNELVMKLLEENLSGEWVENRQGFKLRDKIFVEFGERFQWPDKNEEIKGDKFFCYGLKDQFGILSDGRVVPCCLDSEGEINLGNIFKEDINDILNSQRAKAMVDSFRCKEASEELCKRCGYARRFIK